jgi:hypothetical protein
MCLITWSKKRAQKRVNPWRALRQSKKSEILMISTEWPKYSPKHQEMISAIQVRPITKNNWNRFRKVS